jgi:hypothetical protein
MWGFDLCIGYDEVPTPVEALTKIWKEMSSCIKWAPFGDISCYARGEELPTWLKSCTQQS